MRFGFDKIISQLSFIKSLNNIKINKQPIFENFKRVEIYEWDHSNIMKKQEEFKKYLLWLTDHNKHIMKSKDIKYLNHLKSLSVFKDNPEDEKNRIERIVNKIFHYLFNENDLGIYFIEEFYNEWRESIIDNYIDLYVEQIKEENKFIQKTEKKNFRASMRNERLNEFFIIENIFHINKDLRKISLIGLDRKFSKDDYIKHINFYLNLLLIVEYLLICRETTIEKNFSLNPLQTNLSKKIRELKKFAGDLTWGSYYDDLLYLFNCYMIIEKEEGDNND